MDIVVAWAEGRAGFAPVLWALGLAYVANFVGSVAVAALGFLAAVHAGGDGAVGAAALNLAQRKVELPARRWRCPRPGRTVQR